MSPPKIVVESVRVETDADKRLAALFDKLEQESLDNLEKGARDLLQLVTALFGILFGILALGGDTVAAPLRLPGVILPAAISLLALLITLIAALDVIVPGPYRIRRQSLSDQAGAWERMLRRKRDGLRAAAVSFGIGLSAFATLIAALLYVRWLG